MPENVGIGGSPAAWESCIADMPVCGNFLSIAEGESGLGYLNEVLARTNFVLDNHSVPFVKALSVLCR